MVTTDVVRVSEPVVCTLKLLVRVFTPLPDGGEKTQNPSSDILNLGSRKFWKFSKTHSSIYSPVLLVVGGEGKVFISAFGAVGEGCNPIVIPSLRMAAMLCGDQVLVCTHGWCGNRGGPTPSQTDTGRPLLHRPLPPPPPKTPSLTD